MAVSNSPDFQYGFKEGKGPQEAIFRRIVSGQLMSMKTNPLEIARERVCTWL